MQRRIREGTPNAKRMFGKVSDHSILETALRDNRSLYLKLSGQTTLVKRKLGLEVVNLAGFGRIESISWRV